MYRQATGDALLKMLSVGGQIVSARRNKVAYGGNSGGSVEPATAIALTRLVTTLITPRSARPLPKTVVAFVQMGGTIDKDYPAKMGGYALKLVTVPLNQCCARLHMSH